MLDFGNGFGNGLSSFTRSAPYKISGIRCHSGVNSPFHAVNSGSNPLGDANDSKGLRVTRCLIYPGG